MSHRTSSSSRARARVSKVLLHLTSEPENAPLTIDPSVVGAGSHARQTPEQERAKREMEKAKRRQGAYEQQVKRLRSEYGFDVKEEDATSEPVVGFVSDDVVDDVRGLVLSSKTPTTMTEYDVRCKFQDLCRAAHTLGVATDVVDDVISLKIPGGQGFLVRPFGTRLDEIQTHELEILTVSDLPDLHRDLYSSRPDLSCVFSLRNADAELVSLTSHGILPISQDAIRVLGQSRKADSENLALRASRTAAKHTSIWLIKNRGLVCCGTRPEEALATTVFAVRACAFQARAQVAVGGDLSKLDIPNESDAIRTRAELDSRSDFGMTANAMFDRAKGVHAHGGKL